MRILLTGAAGFIGFHTCQKLLANGAEVAGYDSLNDYYDPQIKELRIKRLKEFPSFTFQRGFLEDDQSLGTFWQKFNPTHVIHLAAQAGVRYSLENPMAYVNSNLVGFQRVMELVRQHKPENFVYASSSSVYGGNKTLPFSESQDVSNPMSLYAATKLANELVAKSYANMYGLPSTGLRFFTVYGPFGRPDMAMFKFAEAMVKGDAIPVYNHGKMVRDFTFITDIVDGILRALATPELAQVYNLGRGKPEMLSDMIGYLEEALDVRAKIQSLPMQPGDVEETSADIAKAQSRLGYNPQVSLKEGIHKFVEWYREFSVTKK
jgi:UDP-glucuronate 4-epimerase